MASPAALALPTLLSLCAGWMGLRGALAARSGTESADGRLASLRAEHGLAGLSLGASALLCWNAVLGGAMLPRLLLLHAAAVVAGWLILRLLPLSRHRPTQQLTQRLTWRPTWRRRRSTPQRIWPLREGAAAADRAAGLSESRGAALPG
jgi:hypothetical protein